MAKPLSVLYVSSEVYPFAKTGGLADVSYALPMAIRDLGHDIRVMLPKYGNISERKNRIHEINRLRDIPIPIGEEVELATVKSSSMNNPRTKVQAYVSTNLNLFDAKKGMYADPVTGKLYENDVRFIFFARTVLQTCLLLGWFPDLIHCNGWQTGLIAAYMRELYPEQFKKTKVVFTIHNFSDQGIFPASSIAKTGLPEHALANISHNKQLNFMKAGIHYADRVTTVSPTYANEIQKSKEIGGGLQTMFKDLEHGLTGIVNGIDQYAWNPKTDPLIAKTYDVDSWKEGKKANKTPLLEKFGLKPIEGAPVIGIISRISQEKGISLLIEALPSILAENVQVVFLGEGDAKMRKELEKIASKHKTKFAAQFVFDEDLAHQLEAGSDMFLMPSLYEPCGLNQFYSMIYGTVPVVRQTGGLADTIMDFDSKAGSGNGIVFKKYDADDLVKTVKKATKLFGDSAAWEQLVKNGMTGEYTWKKSAILYDEVYHSVF